jgi:threonyl-tRNA synthetase
MIHFALMGSIERFLSVYIEHTAGSFPLWLSPIQVAILTISDKQLDYAKKVKQELEGQYLRVQLDEANKTIGAKIRESTLQKIPYMIIIGDREVQVEQCSVRTREGKDLGKMRVNEFIQKLKSQIEKFQ